MYLNIPHIHCHNHHKMDCDNHHPMHVDELGAHHLYLVDLGAHHLYLDELGAHLLLNCKLQLLDQLLAHCCKRDIQMLAS